MENKLEQLFVACDVKRSGFIGRTELQELCKNFNISLQDSDLIFDDLDRDGDGKISFEDFCRGFRDCINTDFGDIHKPDAIETKRKQESVPSSRAEERESGGKPKKKSLRRRDSMHHAFKQFSKTLGEQNVLHYLGNSEEKIQQLYQELVTPETDPGVRAHVETVLGSLVNEMKRLQEENKQMENLIVNEKDLHENRLRLMEEELEAHVAKVDEQARKDAEAKKEQEMKSLEKKMQEEINELQMHLRMFQKVDSWMNKDAGKEDGSEAKKKLEEATMENRGLKMNLTETETSIALLRAEMSQIRSQYEEKCRELRTERQQMEEFMAGQEQIQRQMQLLQEANRRIQDTNDTLRHTMQDENGRGRRSTRPSSQLSSTLGDELENLWETESVRSQHSRGKQNNEEFQFGIPRLMNDLEREIKDCDRDSGVCRSLLNSSAACDEPSCVSDELEAQQDNSVDEYVLPPGDQFHGSPHQLSPYPARHSRLNTKSPALQALPSGKYGPLFEATGPPERTYKVVFAGDAAVGKSTFITRVCKGVFLSNITSTLGVDFQVKTLCLEGKNVAIQLWDTAGQERFRSITKSYFRRADGVMLLYDITSERSFLNVRQWVQSIDEVATSQLPIMLCANKSDLRDRLEKENKSHVTKEQGDRLAREFGAHFHETSAKTGTGMSDAMIELGRRMLTNEDVEVQTSVLKVGDDRRRNNCSGTTSSSSCKKQ